MSGDSGGKKKKDDKPDEGAVPAYLGGTQSTFPQAMPGQLESLASQLSAGFGAPVAQNMAFLDALYSPMSIPAKSVASQPAKSSGSSGIGGALARMGFEDIDPSKVRIRYR